MKARLTAHFIGMIFLFTLVVPLYFPYHNPRASHIDLAQAQSLQSHTRKDKKHFQYLGFLSPPLRLVSRAFTISTPEYDNSSPSYAAAISIACRAPPLSDRLII